MRKTLITAAIAGLLMTSAANAQFYNSSDAGTNIEGNVDINVTQKQQIQAAIGQDIHAEQSAGTIYEGTSIKGNVNINVTQDQQIQAAIGQDITLGQHAGSIGAPKTHN